MCQDKSPTKKDKVEMVPVGADQGLCDRHRGCCRLLQVGDLNAIKFLVRL